jgi:hypothetical protein
MGYNHTPAIQMQGYYSNAESMRNQIQELDNQIKNLSNEEESREDN